MRDVLTEEELQQLEDALVRGAFDENPWKDLVEKAVAALQLQTADVSDLAFTAWWRDVDFDALRAGDPWTAVDYARAAWQECRRRLDQPPVRATTD